MTIEKLTVFLLCGGKGERLKPLTESVPKPLIEINGKPIISYQLDYFKDSGVNDFIVAAGYKAQSFRNYFEHCQQDVKIEIVDSGDVNIIQRIKDSRSLLKGDFLLCYGDTLANVNIKSLLEFHNSHDGLVSMTTYPMQSPFGVIDMDPNGRVIDFREKPMLDHWINIGFMLFRKEVWNYLDRYNNFVDFLEALIPEKKLYSYRHRGIHITVNTIKELHEAEENITHFTDSIVE
jgi:glucose-1-phosphate cytidylyltransferase